MIKSIGTDTGLSVTTEGDLDMLLIELAVVIQHIRIKLERGGSREEAFMKIRECGELAFLDDEEFTKRITGRIQEITDRLQDATE